MGQEWHLYWEAFASFLENGLDLLVPRDPTPWTPRHCCSLSQWVSLSLRPSHASVKTSQSRKGSNILTFVFIVQHIHLYQGKEKTNKQNQKKTPSMFEDKLPNQDYLWGLNWLMILTHKYQSRCFSRCNKSGRVSCKRVYNIWPRKCVSTKMIQIITGIIIRRQYHRRH